MEGILTRVNVLFVYAFISEFSLSLSCHHCIPNHGGSAGCVSFGNNDQNQCSDLDCPEVHVETCANPCVMTTQAFSVPKSCCNSQCGCPLCCSAPYCSIPAPQQMCGLPDYSSCCCDTPCNKGPRPLPPPPPPPPPRPMQQMTPGCCCSYQYPPQMAPPAPSYCVQSVVVGGKADTKKEEGKGKEDEEGKGKPEEDVGKGQGKPENGNGTPGGDPGTGSPRPGGRDPGAGLFIDPVAGGLGGGLGGGLAGLPGLLAGGLKLPIPGLHFCNDESTSKRYENYLEKILDVIKEKAEPESLGPSPIMVMQDCAPRVKVRKIRRRRKQRKYMVESCEAPDDEIVEEEEESPCSCVFATPCCSRSCCPRRMRRCRHFF